jgi:hypothetical protein
MSYPDYDDLLSKNALKRILLIKELAKQTGVSQEVVAMAVLSAQVWELSCELGNHR